MQLQFKCINILIDFCIGKNVSLIGQDAAMSAAYFQYDIRAVAWNAVSTLCIYPVSVYRASQMSYMCAICNLNNVDFSCVFDHSRGAQCSCSIEQTQHIAIVHGCVSISTWTSIFCSCVCAYFQQRANKRTSEQASERVSKRTVYNRIQRYRVAFCMSKLQ